MSTEEFYKTEETDQMNADRLSGAVAAEGEIASIDEVLPEKKERLALLREEAAALEKEVQSLEKTKKYRTERSDEVRNDVAWQGEVMATEEGYPVTVLGENHPLEYYKRQLAEVKERARSKIESTKSELEALGVEVLGEEIINEVYPVLLVRLGDTVGAITDVRNEAHYREESVLIKNEGGPVKMLALSDINFRYGEFSQDPLHHGSGNPAHIGRFKLPSNYKFPHIETEKENFKGGILRLTEIAKSNGLEVVLAGTYSGQSRYKDKSLWNESPDIGGGMVVGIGQMGVVYDLDQKKVTDGQKVKINTGYEGAEQQRVAQRIQNEKNAATKKPFSSSF